MKEALKLLDLMQDIDYGFPDNDKNNLRITNPKLFDDDKYFESIYYLLKPEEVEEYKCGVCFDQVEYERYYLEKKNIISNSYFIEYVDNENMPCHTFLTFQENNKFYWLEHSWGIYEGIFAYNSLEELLNDIKIKFAKFNNIDISKVNIYEYAKPKSGISYKEFLEHCRK